jgi:hypothetical protein
MSKITQTQVLKAFDEYINGIESKSPNQKHIASKKIAFESMIKEYASEADLKGLESLKEKFEEWIKGKDSLTKSKITNLQRVLKQGYFFGDSEKLIGEDFVGNGGEEMAVKSFLKAEVTKHKVDNDKYFKYVAEAAIEKALNGKNISNKQKSFLVEQITQVLKDDKMLEYARKDLYQELTHRTKFTPTKNGFKEEEVKLENTKLVRKDGREKLERDGGLTKDLIDGVAKSVEKFFVDNKQLSKIAQEEAKQQKIEERLNYGSHKCLSIIKAIQHKLDKILGNLKEGGKLSKELEQIKGKIEGFKSSIKSDINKNQTIIKFKIESNKPKREL